MDLTHFYVKAVPLNGTNSYKNNDFIKCINEYIFKDFEIKDEYQNVELYIFGINSQGLQFVNYNLDGYYAKKPLEKNFWVYLGGVPTSEIRK